MTDPIFPRTAAADMSVTRVAASDDDVAKRVRFDESIHSGGDDDRFAAEDPEFARTVQLLQGALGPAWTDSAVGHADVFRDALADAPTDKSIPPSLGRFEIQEQIGSGAFGTVWRAWDPLLQRIVAVKVPRPEIRMDLEVSRRFLREARAAARLNHPGIVRVLDAGTADGVAYLAADFVEGESLGQLLRRVERLPVREAAALVRSLADAVSHAHQNGVLHRDIKPDNVLMEASPVAETEGNVVPRLTDFGLAQITDDDGGRSRVGLVIGTPNYMAPEQLAGETDRHGTATDVFSLGVVLYKLLMGRIPNDAEGSTDALIRAASRKFESLCRQRPEIPRDLESICLKCVAREPQHRYQTADALRADLDRFLAGQPTVARPLPIRERLVRWCTENLALATAFTLVVMSLVVVAGVSWSSRNFERTQNVLLQDALTEKNVEREKAIESEVKFRELAWTTGIQQAYGYHANGDQISTRKALDALRKSHADATDRIEWVLLDAELHEQYQTIYTTDEPLNEVVLIPGTQKVVVAGNTSKLKFINLVTGEVESFNLGISSVHALAVSDDGKQLAAGGAGDSLNAPRPVVIDLQTMTKHTANAPSGTATIESLAFSPYGDSLAVGHRYEGVVVIPADPNSTRSKVQLQGDRRNHSIAWITADADEPEMLATVRSSEIIQFTDFAGVVHKEILRHESFTCFCRLPDSGDMILARRGKDYLDVVRINSANNTTMTLVGCPANVECVAATDHREWVAAGHADGQVAIWDVSDYDPDSEIIPGQWANIKPTLVVRRHEGAVASMQWVGSRLVTVGADGRVAAIDVGREISQRQHPLHDVASVCFQGQSHNVLLGSRNGTVYRVAARELDTLSRDNAGNTGVPAIDEPAGVQHLDQQVVEAFDSAITALACSDDGATIGVGTQDGTLRVLQASDGSVQHTFEDSEAKRKQSSVKSIVFSRTADRVCWTGASQLNCQSLTGESVSFRRKCTSGGKPSLLHLMSPGLVYRGFLKV